MKVARTVWKQGKCREASTYAYYIATCVTLIVFDEVLKMLESIKGL